MIDEAHAKNMALIQQSYDREVALVREQNAREDAALDCMLAAYQLEIGVASEQDLPCRRPEGLINYARVNLTESGAGSLTQWVYEGPRRQAAYLYFDGRGILRAKQLF